MLLTCMLNVGHWTLPTNCLMKCWRGILFPGLLSFMGMPSMVDLMGVLGSLGHVNLAPANGVCVWQSD